MSMKPLDAPSEVPAFRPVDRLLESADAMAMDLFKSEAADDVEFRTELLNHDFATARASLRRRYPNLSDAGAALTTVRARKTLRALMSKKGSAP